MKSFLGGILGGALLYAALAVAQSGGGYPFFAQFGTVNVNSRGLAPTEGFTLAATPSTVGKAAIYSNGTIVSTGNTLAHANQTVTNTQVYIQGGSAEYVTDAGTAGTDNKIWSFVGLNDGTYRWRSENDALTGTTDLLVLTRTGIASATYKIQPQGAGNATITDSPPTAATFLENVSSCTTAGVCSGLGVFAGTNSSDIAFQVNNASNTTNYFRVRGDGAVFQQNTIQPRVAWGQIVQGAGTCSIGGGATSGGFSSCAFAATGSSTVTIAESFSGAPSCVATIQAGAGTNAETTVNAASSTSIQVNAAIAGAATNETLFLVCVGT